MELFDPYENDAYVNHIYVIENIPTNETEDLFEEVFTEGCTCENMCTLQTCSCLQKYGINYIKNSETLINKNLNYTLDNNKFNHGLYECNSSCKCKNNFCGNRLVQFGPRNNLEIKDCVAKGKGLFTKEKIYKGTFICEYAGEVITKNEALQRLLHNEKNNLMNYILCVNEHFGPRLSVTYIDPTYFGNIGRYINHSCNPNCDIISVRINNTIPKLCIFAKKEIEENTEITFNYGETKTLLPGGKINLTPCFCSEQNCKKWLPYLPEI